MWDFPTPWQDRTAVRRWSRIAVRISSCLDHTCSSRRSWTQVVPSCCQTALRSSTSSRSARDEAKATTDMAGYLPLHLRAQAGIGETAHEDLADQPGLLFVDRGEALVDVQPGDRGQHRDRAVEGAFEHLDLGVDLVGAGGVVPLGEGLQLCDAVGSELLPGEDLPG